MYRLSQLFYKHTHILSAPILTSKKSLTITLEVVGIGNLYTCYRIRIEVIINMQSVDIIACQDISYHLADIVTILSQCRIQQCQSIILEAALRITTYHMISGISMCRLGLGTIRVNPSMQLHTTLMTLLYHPLQRVPIRLWCLTLLTSKIIAPRLYLTLVECITLWAHLEDDSITTILLQLVELISQHLLHLLSRHTLKLSVDTLYPCTTKFTLHLRPCGASEE